MHVLVAIMSFLGFGRGYEDVDDDDDSKERVELMINIVTLVVSMVMIALVTIIVTANLDGSQQGAGTMKTLLNVCRKTDEPESCVRLLKHVGERATVLDYVKAAINATLEELRVVKMPKIDLEVNLKPLQAQAYGDCLQLLTLAKEELDFLYTTLSMLPVRTITAPQNVLNSLSAVISYQQACAAGLMRTDSYMFLGFSLQKPIRLTRITLAIVDNFSYSEFEKHSTDDDHDHDNQLDGNSGWFSGAQRKMMEYQRNGDDEGIDAVVAQDGSGHFATISESFNACPKKNFKGERPCVIYVKKGEYKERVVVPMDVGQVIMYGDGPMNTIVTGISTGDHKISTTQFRAATFVVMGKEFICKNMGFTAPVTITGAPALLVLSDHAAFFNCKIDGEEGSLHAMAQRQFYRDCEIHGNVDIIKGDSATVIQNSLIIVKPRYSIDLVLRRNMVSAQSRTDRYETTGLVIQNCTITTAQGESGNNSLADSTFLGTPNTEYSRTIIMESFLGDVIHPGGWCKWSDNYGIETATFREYNNRGPRGNTDKRVRWHSYRTVLQRNQMESFLANKFIIQASPWLQNTGIPYESGFIYKQ